MVRTFIVAGALLGMLATVLGAFASHGLEGRLAPDLLAVFEIGVRYQFYHALALLLVGLLGLHGSSRLLAWSGGLFLGGTLVFSGSLYILALSGVHVLGAITPLGGTAMVIGWLLLALAAWRRKDQIAR